MKARDRVVLSWPDPGQVEGSFCTSMIELVRARGSRIEGVLRVEGGLLSRQRNEIVKHFLDDMTADWLFMIDSDETITPQAFDKLVGAAHSTERPVVAGLYFGTWPGNLLPRPVPHLYREAGDGVSAAPVMDYPPDSIIEIDRAGTGALLVHRSVLQAIRDQASDHEGRDWCWFRDLPVGGLWLGEDMYFCRRVRSLGFKIHAHTGAILHHRRRYWLDQRMFEAMREVPEVDPLDGVGLVIPTRGDHLDLLCAIIATSGLPPERVAVVWTGADEVPDLPATVLRDDGPLNIQRWWNVGLNLLAGRGCTRVAVLNDDLIIAPDTLPHMASGLGDATLALLEEEHISGHCWMLNVTHGVRPDESFRWYCGDFQLVADAMQAHGLVRVAAQCEHRHHAESTKSSPELLELAAADEALYDSRHPAGSRFAAVRRG